MVKTDKVTPKTIYIEALQQKRRHSFISFVAQFFVLFIGMTGFVYCVATSLHMPYGYFTIAAISLPFMLISALFTLNKKIYIPFICVFSGILLCVVLFLRSLASKITEAFIFCYNLTIQLVVDEGYTNYQSAMTADISDIISEPEIMNGYFLTVILVLIIVFSVIFTSTMMKRSLVWVCVLPCFAVLTPSLFYGAVPSGDAFCIFISGIIASYVESISYFIYRRSVNTDANVGKPKKKNHIGYALQCAVNAFVCCIIVLVMSLTVYVNVYSSEVLQLDNVREMLDSAAEKLFNKLFYSQYETSEGAVGGLLDGNILELKTPNFRDLPVMTVTTDTNTSLYMRGWIGDELVNDGWTILDDDDTMNYRLKVGEKFDQYTQLIKYHEIVSKSEMADAVLPSQTVGLGFVYDTVRVKCAYKKSLMMFVPVTGRDGEVAGKYRGIDVIGDSISFFKDKRPASNTYTINAALQSFSDRSFYSSFEERRADYLMMASQVMKLTVEKNEQEQFIYDERKYKEYVDQTYLKMPDEDTEFIKEAALKETDGYTSDFEKALVLERYFKSNFKYAQHFTYAEGSAVNKIKYMMETSKTGYCTYFATAMTLAARSIGLPARYVTGYHAMIVPNTGAENYVRNIKDNNYHAWVEVYFDGIGWLSFDPTPGVSGNLVIRDYNFLDESSKPSEDTPEPPEDVEPDHPDPLDDDDWDGGIGNEMPFDHDLPGWAIALIVAISVIVLLAIAVAVTVIMINGKFNKARNRIDTLSPTEKVSAVYPFILRLLWALGYRLMPGEQIGDFAKRVDAAYESTVKLESIIDVLEMSQFSENTVDDHSAAVIVGYFDKLSVSAFYSMNVFKKYYCMATIDKRVF